MMRRPGAPAARDAVWVLLAAAGYAVAMVVGLRTRIDATMVSLVWPAAGASTAWLLAARGRRRVPTLVAMGLVTVLANAAAGVGAVASVGWGAVNVLHAVVAVCVLRLLGWRGTRRLRRVGDLVTLVCAAVAASVVSGVTGSLLAAWRLGVPVLGGVELILVRNAVSTVVVVSVVLALLGRASSPRGPADPRERVVGTVVTLAGTAALLVVGPPTLVFLLLPTTVWAATRTGVRSTTLLAAGQGAVAVAVTYLGEGPFGQLRDTEQRVLLAQTLVAAVHLLGLWVALAESERVRAHERSRSSLEQLQRNLDAALVGQATLHLLADGRATVVAANPALGRLVGVPPADLLRTDWLELVEPDDREALRVALVQLASGGRPGWQGELRMHGPGGDDVWVEAVLGRVTTPSEAPRRAMVITAQVLDVTARKLAEQRLSHLALHDELTGLPNRSLWRDRAQQALDVATRTGGRVGVLYVDLDRFKAVNDQHGHETGDLLLQEVARRITAHVRPQDTVARLGGDEFVVLCPDVPDELTLAMVAHRALTCLGPVVLADGTRLVVTVSIGTTLSSPEEGDVQRLLRQADAALYEAKQSGRSRAESFGSAHDLARRRLPLLQELGRAIANDELVVHHQPVVDLRTGVSTGVEVLVRWQHPVRGLLPPAAWLDAIEHSDLVYAAGLRVLQLGCAEGARLQQGGVPLTVSVNVSARQLDRPGLVTAVEEALERTGLPPRLLVLELTETHLLAVEGTLLADLHALRALGVRFAADDVGTGYSTLAHLVELPIDVLKLDRSFVAGLGVQQAAHAVSNGVVAMARDLGIACVAEGVETRAQAELLLDMGYTSAQGFLWSPALPLDEVERWLVRQGRPALQDGAPAASRA